MLNFKKLFLSVLSGVITSFQVNAQSNPIISAGMSVSGSVCTQGQVYTWGLNKQGPFGNIVTGTLGTGSTAQNVNVPQQVIFPTGVVIQQLETGFAYFLAIDCSGKVWGWGDNGAGQLGTGNTNMQTIPQRVLVQAGSAVDVAGFRDPATGQLRRIVKLAAGNASSFAITDDGRLLSWGCNGTGCDPIGTGLLGDGSTVNQAYPVFVKNGAANLPLENVIDISVGDNLAIALVDEYQEGVGIGTVYTWGKGNNGSLGRNASGNGNNGYELTFSNVARPARFQNNTQGPSGDGYLRNITAIAAGDVAGFALDIDGYVWAWGNGGYGGVTGQGQTVTHSDPRRVLKGTATGEGTDGTFLLAQSIAAGNAFAVAVTLDGKPVAWGNNACSMNSVGPAASPNFSCGGNLGNNGLGGFSITSPSYIQNNSGTVHNDVLSINSGGFHGYYTRQDNSVWAWGDNIVGQLGIGNYVTQNRAVQLSTIATGCSSPEPAPQSNISPRDVTVCASKLTTSPIVLNSGLELSSVLLSKYMFTWYRVANPNSLVSSADTSAGNKIKGPFTGAAGSTFMVTQPGRYWVKIEYIGTNSPCGGYIPSYDYVTVTTFPATFNAPTNLTYCAATSRVNVLQAAPSLANPIYDWYPSPTSTTSLGTSIGSSSTTIDISTATISGINKIVYVEETSQKSGIVLKKSQACDTNFRSFDPLSTSNSSPLSQSGFTTFEDNVTITTLNIRLRSSIFNVGTYSATLNFDIYGSKTSNGQLVANEANLIGSFNYNFNRIKTTDPSDLISDYLVTVNIKLPQAGTYFISLKPTQLTSVTGSGLLSIGRGSCTQTVPIQSLPNGIISYTHQSQAFQNPQSGANLGSGQFFNVGFATSQGFCERIPVTLKLNCPCNPPATVTITGSPFIAGLPKVITVCSGGNVPTLSGAYTKGASVNTNNYFYSWYKKGTLPAYTNSGSQVSGSVILGVPILPSTSASAGTYYLRVEDGNAGISACYKTDSVQFIVLPNSDPKCTITEVFEADELSNTIRISPSPFKEQFTLETSGMEKVLVHDQRGVLIEEKSLVNLKDIQLGQTWSSGLYMLQLVGNGSVKTVKVIKEQ